VRLIAALLLAALWVDPLAASTRYLADTAWARDPVDKRLLYREQHGLRFAADGRLIERRVLYRCADGTPFARKRVDYGTDAEAPEFALDDARSGYREGLRRRDGRREAFVQYPGEAERSARLDAGAMVADAGFDRWARAHWDRLTAGERLDLRFLVPSRLAAYAFSVQAVPAAPAADEYRFRLRLGGWLGWLAPYIDVSYAASDRRLLRFEGLSNLRDDRGGRPLRVRIDFPAPAQPASAADFAAIDAEPLRACRVGG